MHSGFFDINNKFLVLGIRWPSRWSDLCSDLSRLYLGLRRTALD